MRCQTTFDSAVGLRGKSVLISAAHANNEKVISKRYIVITNY